MNFYCGFKFFIIYLIFIISLSLLFSLLVVRQLAMAAIIEKISLYQNMHFGVRHKSRSSIKLVAKVTFVIKCGTLNLQLVRKIITNFHSNIHTKKENYFQFWLCFQMSHAKFYWIIILIYFFFLKNLVFVDDQLIIIYEKSLISLSLSFHELKMINSNVISHLSLLLIEFFYFFFWCV